MFACLSDGARASRDILSVYSFLSTGPHQIDQAALILESTCAAPDPSGALNNFERILSEAESPESLAAELCASPDRIRSVLRVLGTSQFLTNVMIRDPKLALWMSSDPVLKTQRRRADYAATCNAALQDYHDRDERRDALCRIKRRELLRIGARDILQLSDVEEVSRETSDLAQALISAAAQMAWEETAARFGEPRPEAAAEQRVSGMCVLGMGKLGGRELNFSSDIDLIFIYDSEGQTSGTSQAKRRATSQSNHVFFTKMGETLVRFLGERGPEGNLFRVDMRLRPEGSTGPLARSLESFVNYLSEQARDWERLAYLKARVMYGPAELADRLYRVIDRFVFSAVEPERIVREVEHLKVMIDREVVNSDLYMREVKRGYGGIREIEFVIATMQIVYGKTHRALHVRNFFIAVERLRDVNLLSSEEADFYFQAYAFLRMIEHRLQMREERQTHTMPVDPEELERLARSCGLADARALLAEYKRITEGVHERFGRFFNQNVEEIGRETQDLLLVLNRQAPEQEALDSLARLGVNDPAALPLLRDMASGTREVFITADGQRYFEQMLPSLLRLTAQAPVPDKVLRHFHSFMLAIKGTTYYYELIARHPDILNLLVSLFGTSDYFSEVLISHPEFFDTIISSHILYDRETTEHQRSRIKAAITSGRTLERKLINLRRATKFETLLVALRYLLRLRSLYQTLLSLSDAADVVVELAMPIAAERTAERLAPRAGGDIPSVRQALLNLIERRWAVVGLGKFGGREINFFSDLDVVFIYGDSSDAPASELERAVPASEIFSSLADSLTYVISENVQEGRAFTLDARLRPHGKNSPIATPVSHYISYFEDEAEVWELQSFLRARQVAGNPDILQSVKEAAWRRTGSFSRERVREEMASMRRRLEATVTADKLTVKRAVGGIVDVEFVVQFLQLGGLIPRASTTNYFALLGNIAQCDVLSVEDAEVLGYGYSYLRLFETAARLVTGSSEGPIPDSEQIHAAAEKIMSVLSQGDPFGETRRVMARIREVYNRVIGHPAAQ